MSDLLPGSAFPAPTHPAVRILPKRMKCDACGYDRKLGRDASERERGEYWHWCFA